jgi:hypothetical protein
MAIVICTPAPFFIILFFLLFVAFGLCFLKFLVSGMKYQLIERGKSGEVADRGELSACPNASGDEV